MSNGHSFGGFFQDPERSLYAQKSIAFLKWGYWLCYKGNADQKGLGLGPPTFALDHD
jgi:hypothetical protein